jgi:hypothetical protein
MRRTLFTLSMLFVAISAAGQTGNWSGTYTYSVTLGNCSNKTFSASGNASMTLLQTGTSIAGRLDLANFLVFTNTCTATTGEVTTALVGRVSGSVIEWIIPTDPNGQDFIGSIDANSISVQWTDSSGGLGSLTFTRTSGDAPAADMTGTWGGTYNFTDRCSNGKTQTYTGAFTLGLAQTDANAGGVVTMRNVPLYDQNCSKLTSLDMVMAVAGTVSGSTFAGGVVDPSGSFEFPITATINGQSAGGSVNGASGTSTTGTFTLTRSSANRPASDFGGTYEGSYSETDNESFRCVNIGALSYAGAASLSIRQADNAVSGWITMHDTADVISDGFGNCLAVPAGDQVLPLYGTLSGNVLTLSLPVGGGSDLFRFTFSNETATGTLQDPVGDFASMTLTRTAPEAGFVPRSKRRIVKP